MTIGTRLAVGDSCVTPANVALGYLVHILCHSLFRVFFSPRNNQLGRTRDRHLAMELHARVLTVVLLIEYVTQRAGIPKLLF